MRNFYVSMLAILLCTFTSVDLQAQLSGTKSIPGDYPTIAAAVTDLNTAGVGAGGVVFNVAAGHTETTDIPALTATGTVADPIVFQKSGAGANPVVTPLTAGSVASSTSLGVNGDAIIIIEGGDYITFDGIDIQTDASFTGNGMYEYGYLLKKASGTNACKNVTIRNAAITLNKDARYSFGVFVSNLSGTSSVTVTSTDGRSENIKLYGLTISNSYGGIQVRGYASSSPYEYYDQNIEIGVDGPNSITDYGNVTPANTTYGIYAIYQNNLKIANNTIANNTQHTTTLYGIFCSTGNNSSVDIYNNNVTLTSNATTSTLYAINNSMGASGTNNVVRMYNNTVGLNYTSASSGTFYGVYQSATVFRSEIYGNTVTGVTKSGTSASYLVYGANTSAGGTSLIYNNTVFNNNNTGSGDMYCVYSNPVSTTTVEMYGNTVYNNSSNNGTVFGVVSTTGGTVSVHHNKVYDLTATGLDGSIRGMQSSSGTDVTWSNNIVGNLFAPDAENGNDIAGLYIVSGTNVNVYYNTIYLNATSTSAGFGTMGIYSTTTPTIDLRNNLIVNTSTAGAGGYTAAYRRSGTSLDDYAATSNNNAFYAGTPGAQNVIFYDGTNADQTLADFQARVAPRESFSVTENPTFLSTTGSAADFLHIDATVNTTLESAAENVAGITDDFDGQTRQGNIGYAGTGVKPDIGADEFEGTNPNISALDVGALSIASPSTTGCYSATETVTVTIYNYGTATLDFSVNPVTVTTEVTGAATQTLTAVVNTGTLASFASMDVDMSTTLNMSAAGTYTFNAYTTLTGDGNSGNDASPSEDRTVIAPQTLPQQVDFTGFTGSNLTAVFPNWSEASGLTEPSGTTSSWVASNNLGTPGNVTAKVNLYDTFHDDWIVGPTVVPTATTDLKVSVAVTNYNSVTTGDVMGSDDSVHVMISTDCGVSWQSIRVFTVADNLTMNLTEYSIPLGSYAGQPIILAFFATDGPVNDLEDYDFHIDNISIQEPASLDVGPSAISLPANACPDPSVPLEVTINNYSTSVLDFAVNPVTVTLDVTGAATATMNAVVNTGTLAAGASMNVVVSPNLDMSAGGTYNFIATTTLTGDGSPLNDSYGASHDVSPGAPVSLPEQVDFTGFTGADLNTVFPNWNEASGSVSPSGTTSSWVSSTVIAGSGTTAKVNLFSTGKNEWIVGPRFMATSASEVLYKIAITNYNNSDPDPDGMGSDDAVIVRITNDCGATWTDLRTYNVGNTGSVTNSLQQETISLGAYAGQMIQIAFFATEGSVNDLPDYDFHIDDINIRNNIPLDLGATALASQSSGSCFTNAETISIEITNLGTSPVDFAVTPVTVNTQVTGAATASLSGSLNTGVLAPGATTTVDMTATLDMSAPGDYIFNASTTVTGDGLADNDDMAETTISVLPVDAGTVVSDPESICVSGTPNLSVSGYSGVNIQWQETTDDVNGPWNNVGTNSDTYTPASAITVTMYYRVIVTCNANADTSNIVTVVLNNPQVLTTTPATRCGTGTVTLGATGTDGATLSWYDAASGGNLLGTGTSLVTPSISSTTTFYVSAGIGSTLGSVGPVSPSALGTISASNFTNYYQEFDVIIPSVTIASIDVFPTAPIGSSSSIIIEDNGGNGLFSVPFVTTVTGGNVQTIPLNITLSQGTGYRMRQGSAINLNRNTSGAVYPFTSAAINVTGNNFNVDYWYYFYNWQFVTGCQSARTAVTATVNTPPAIQLTAADDTLCLGDSTQLSVVSANDPNYTYTWEPGSGAGSTYTAVPSATTYYVVTAIDNSGGANDGCVNVDSVEIAVNPLPVAPVITVVNDTICVNDVEMLSTTLNAGAGYIGTGSSSTTTTTPYKGYWGGMKVQMLYTAAELTALGMTQGSAITQVGFDIATYVGSYTFNGFNIAMKNTSSSVLVSAFETGLTTVLPANNMTLTGAAPFESSHTLATPFVWDGVSNLLVQFCFNNNNTGGGATNYSAGVRYTSVTGHTVYSSVDNDPILCDDDAGTVSSIRPNIKLTYVEEANVTWAPLTGLFTDASATTPYTGGHALQVYAQPLTTTTYTATKTSTATDCGNTAEVEIYVKPGVVISVQPESQSICSGGDVTFMVTATGNGTLSYQWRKDGVDISGANSASYTILGATAVDLGLYDVVITDECGPVDSDDAALTFTAPPAIATEPTDQTSCIGGSVTFSVAATGTNLSYQWQFGGVDITGAIFSDLTINNVQPSDAGNYSVIITGDCGSATSINAALAIVANTSINTQPLSQSICPGDPVTFTVVAAGSGTITYQWRKDGVDIPGANADSYTIAAVSASDAGNYSVSVTSNCGTTVSDNAALTVLVTTEVTVDPEPDVICSGTSFTIDVTAVGSGTLTYQWRKDGIDIPGANSASYSVALAGSADAGTYDVIVNGDCGADTSAQALVILGDIVIDVDPISQTICEGDPVTFIAAAGGAVTSYQWRKDGVDITGATGDTYTIAAVAPGDAGLYDVVVTGDCGTSTSAAATLTVNPATVIDVQPVAQTACANEDITLSVTASGLNLSYQWQFNGNDISGATGDTYTIVGAQPANSGNYQVVVTGDCGTVTSTSVAILVNTPGTWLGFTSDWNDPNNWCGSVPTATTDVQITSAAPNMPVISGPAAARDIVVHINASLTIAAGGTLDLYGNFTNDGTFTSASGNIEFRGASSQSMPAFTANNVTMNGDGGVVLGGSATVNGHMTFTNGNITLGANDLTLSSNGPGSIASHIITNGSGEVIVKDLAASSSRTVPVGIDAATYNPVVLAANATHTIDDYTVRVIEGVYQNGTSGTRFTSHVVDRTWLIDEVVPGGSNVNITLQWTGIQELPSFLRSDSYVMHYLNGSWQNQIASPAVGTDPYLQTRDNVTSFSPFAVQTQIVPDVSTGIYPNPAVSRLYVVVESLVPENLVLTIYDSKGSMVKKVETSINGGRSQVEVDVFDLSGGTYVLKVHTREGREIMTRRFVRGS